MYKLSEQVAPGFVGTQFVEDAKKSWVQRAFPFPNPVNEYAARCTAALVVVLALTALLTGQVWLVAVLAFGFVLRVAWGPKISPFGILSVKVLAPRVGEPKMVPGPPKRFAQTIGAVLSLAALALLLSGVTIVGWALIVMLIMAAALEAVIGFCLGCAIFGFLQRRGVIPESVCEACANFGKKPSAK